MNQWIVFDVMGVIFKVGDDTNDLLVPFVQELDSNISRETVNDLYVAASLGEINSREFWEKLGFAKQYPEIEREYLDTRLTIDREFKDVAQRLRERFCLGILSNDVSEWSMYLQKKYRLDFFHAIVISGDVGYRKPDRKIYEILLQTVKAKPDNCIFVDDRCRNLIPAKKIGIKTIRFAREFEESEFRPDTEITSFKELEKAIEEVS